MHSLNPYEAREASPFFVMWGQGMILFGDIVKKEKEDFSQSTQLTT